MSAFTPMNNNQPLRIKSLKDNFEIIRKYIKRKLILHEVKNRSDRENILLAAMEAVTNISIHGYQNHPGAIEIEVIRQKDSIRIYLRDQAPIFDPQIIEAPDFSIPLEERPMGGLGIYLINQIMDQVIHKSLPQGGNELILVKKISHQES